MSTQLPAPAVTADKQTRSSTSRTKGFFGSKNAKDDAAITEPRPVGPTLLDDVYATLLEFIGTTLFLLLGLGGVQSAVTSLGASRTSPTNGSTTESLFFEAFSMGISLAVTLWLFYRLGAGLFNPNVTFALLLIGAIKPLRFIMFVLAQFVAAIVASALLQALLPGSLRVNTIPGAGTSKAQAVFIEMFITAALCFAVLRLTGHKHGFKNDNRHLANHSHKNGVTSKHDINYKRGGHHIGLDEPYPESTVLVPIGLGLTFFLGQLFAIQFTGASSNTARSFGPAVVTSFNRSHWVYWVGPFAGSLLAAAAYKLLDLFHRRQIDHHGDIENLAAQPSATSTGVDALRVTAQIANVNGRRMNVATVPFIGLPSINSKIAPTDFDVPTNLTLVFDPIAPVAPIAVVNDHTAAIAPPRDVRGSVSTAGTAL